MAVTSEPSPFTSVTASPLESHDAHDIPLELKIPLPTSSACSDKEEAKEKDEVTTELNHDPPKVQRESYIEPQDSATERTLDTATEDIRPEETLSPSAVWMELARLVDLEAYQKRCAIEAKHGLERLKLSCGVDKRLIATFSIAYGNMIDQYKTDDQGGFSGLYEAWEQLKSSCAQYPPSLSLSKAALEGLPNQGFDNCSQTSIRTLPLDDQSNIIAFLTQIRTEPDFLADRICHLTSTELAALTSSYHPPGIDFSILQNHSHGKSQFFSRDSQMMKLSRRMDNLNWFHKQDPFFNLLYGAFDPAARPGSREHARRLEIWSATCARTMVEGFGGSRPGSDELIIATLDAFANTQEWPLIPKMEFYLMDVLARGAFMLDSSASQSVSMREPPETQNAKVAVAEADFFESALLGLFDVLATDKISMAVPASVLALSRAILDRIEDPKVRLRGQQFIAIRWYFATYLSSVLVYPEVRGIMMTHFIGESARRLILQKLVIRLQEQVFDIILPGNDGALVNPRIKDTIAAIFQTFAPIARSPIHVDAVSTGSHQEAASTRFLILTPTDIIGLVQTLYPERPSHQGSAEKANAVSVSDRPSTAGSSTLVAGVSDLDSVVLTPIQYATRDADAEEPMTAGPSPRVERPHNALEGEFSHPTKAEEISQKGPDFRIRVTCQRLRDLTTHKKDSFSNASLDAWVFIPYSEDSLTLSLDLNVSKPAVDIIRGNTKICDDADKIGSTDRPDTYRTLKAEIIRLLQENKDFDPESADTTFSSSTLSAVKDSFELLKCFMQTAMDKARSRLDLVGAHRWLRNLQSYQNYLACHPSKPSRTLLHELGEDLRRAVSIAADFTKDCDNQCRSLSKLQTRNKGILAKLEELRNALRLKMWYVSDVRHSAPYEEALYVTRALRNMASARKSKHPGSISSWARQRLRGSNIHDRAESQVFEAMVSSKEHCGISKLADEQLDLTSRWLTRRSIENFCKSEERIHRFCYEVQKATGKIAGTSLLESPVLWSSNLFKRDRLAFDKLRSRSVVPPSVNPNLGPLLQFEAGRSLTPSAGIYNQSFQPALFARSTTNQSGNLWANNPPARPTTGLGLHGNQPLLPPTPTSPLMSWPNAPLSPGSPLHAPAVSFPSKDSSVIDRVEVSPVEQIFAEHIKKTLCSLLISDLGYLLWNQGSETDVWVNEHGKAMGTELNLPSRPREAQTYLKRSMPSQASFSDGVQFKPSDSPISASTVDESHTGRKEAYEDQSSFLDSYQILLQRMSLYQDPYKKLELLYELETLIVQSMVDPPSVVSMLLDSTRPSPDYVSSGLRNRSVPRTKATSLEEVIANCTERRAGTTLSQGSMTNRAAMTSQTSSVSSNIPNADDIVGALYTIFKSSAFRPSTLFRDLQYIAAFVPASILDQAAQGKAFWNAGLAALALKEDFCKSLISRANSITSYHVSSNISADPAVDTALASTSLRDAAKLWLTTAKEGSPVAARELGLFYLTHPDLLPRVTMPFSRAKDVFRSVGTIDGRSGDKERGALDLQTFAVVFHWMEIAANGGDKDAADFLRGNGDLSRAR